MRKSILSVFMASIRVLAGCTAIIVMLFVIQFFISAVSWGITRLNGPLDADVLANVSKDSIHADDAMKKIKELTSEKYCGRLTGTRGNQLAADYIADYFEDIGLESPAPIINYMQYYDQQVITLDYTPELAIVDIDSRTVKTFDYAVDYVLRGLSSTTNKVDLTGALHVANNLSDIRGKDLNGKILVLTEEIKKKIYIDRIINEAATAGASGLISMDKMQGPFGKYNSMVVTPMKFEAFPYIKVNENAYGEIMDAAKKGELLSLKLSYSMNDKAKVPNVIGVIQGSDNKLKDEYIIICAHFDHVGENMNGKYNPGALDNASGTSVMMEVARIIKQNKIVPKKSIMFVGFNGEEEGLKGSSYFADNPPYDIKKAEVINLDMVGAASIAHLTICSATGKNTKLAENMQAYASKLKMSASQEFYESSDHASFVQDNIEAVTLSNTEMSRGYHSYGDTIEDISSDNVKDIIELLIYYVDKSAY